MLSETDWVVVRATEMQREVDLSIKEFRQSIRDYSNQLETSINNCSNVEQLIEVTNGWQWPSQNEQPIVEIVE